MKKWFFILFFCAGNIFSQVFSQKISEKKTEEKPVLSNNKNVLSPEKKTIPNEDSIRNPDEKPVLSYKKDSRIIPNSERDKYKTHGMEHPEVETKPVQSNKKETGQNIKRE